MSESHDEEKIRLWVKDALQTPEGRKEWLSRHLVPETYMLLSAEELKAIQQNVFSASQQLILWRAAAMDQLGEQNPEAAHEAMKRLKQRSELGTRMQTALKLLLAMGLSQQQRKVVQTALRTDLLVQP